MGVDRWREHPCRLARAVARWAISPAYVGQLLISRCQQFDIAAAFVATTTATSLHRQLRIRMIWRCMYVSPRSCCPHFFCSRAHRISNGNGEAARC